MPSYDHYCVPTRKQTIGRTDGRRDGGTDGVREGRTDRRRDGEKKRDREMYIEVHTGAEIYIEKIETLN